MASSFSVKTDRLVVEAHDEAKARELLTFDKDIGTWRVSKNEDLIFFFDALTVKESPEILVKNLSVNHVSLKDDWDVNELCALFEEKKRVMVRAVYAGSGKSFACKAMEQRSKGGIRCPSFVQPTSWRKTTAKAELP